MDKFWSSGRPVGQTHWTQLSVELGGLTGKCLWASLMKRQGNGEEREGGNGERCTEGESSFVILQHNCNLGMMLESTHMYIAGLFHSLQMSKPKLFFAHGASIGTLMSASVQWELWTP